MPRGAPMKVSPVGEVLIAFAAVALATVLISIVGRLPPLDEYVQLAVAGLFLWTAVQMSQRQPDGLTRYGLRLGGLLDPPEHPPAGFAATFLDLAVALQRAAPFALREFAAAMLVAAVVFPPFVLGFYFFQAPSRAFELVLPAQLASYILSQLVVVGLPEEALFRGYFQGRLSEHFARRTCVLGASLSLPALLAQAALFALLHFAVEPRPERLAVFFPGLLFGWLRARRGGIGAGVVLHGACNLLSDVLVRSWL